VELVRLRIQMLFSVGSDCTSEGKEWTAKFQLPFSKVCQHCILICPPALCLYKKKGRKSLAGSGFFTIFAASLAGVGVKRAKETKIK
jgi:hypothetical protein